MMLDDYMKHKTHLYKFFNQYTEKVNDYQVWKLIGRIKTILKEPLRDIIATKKSELISLQKAGWNVELAIVELVERALIDLVTLLEKDTITNEERAYIKTTAIAIEQAL